MMNVTPLLPLAICIQVIHSYIVYRGVILAFLLGLFLNISRQCASYTVDLRQAE